MPVPTPLPGTQVTIRGRVVASSHAADDNWVIVQLGDDPDPGDTSIPCVQVHPRYVTADGAPAPG